MRKNREGSEDTDGRDVAALQAEIDRMSSLSPAQLAEEVMTKGFGQGGPNYGDDMLNEQRYALARTPAEAIAMEFVDGPEDHRGGLVRPSLRCGRRWFGWSRKASSSLSTHPW